MALSNETSIPHGHYAVGAPADGFVVREADCAPHPDGAAAHGLYGESAVAWVLSGGVEYRAGNGSAAIAPGAIVFANRGEGFSCQHTEARANRRLIVFFGAEMINAAAEIAGARRFARAALAPSKPAAHCAALVRQAAHGSTEAALALALAGLGLDLPRRGPSVADARRVSTVMRYVQAHYSEPCALDALAALAGVSPSHFVRLFKAAAGVTPAQYVLHARLNAAARRLETSAAPVCEIAYEVGFNDLSHFNSSFKAAFAMTPSAWRGSRN
jgi:AraC-like DNA-binding protein